MAEIIDLSQEIYAGMPVFPGLPEVEIHIHATHEEWDGITGSDVVSPAVDSSSGPIVWMWKTELDGHRDFGLAVVPTALRRSKTARTHFDRRPCAAPLVELRLWQPSCCDPCVVKPTQRAACCN